MDNKLITNEKKIKKNITNEILLSSLIIFFLILIFKFVDSGGGNFYNTEIKNNTGFDFKIRDNTLILNDDRFGCNNDFLKDNQNIKIYINNSGYYDWFRTNYSNEIIVNKIIKQYKTKDEVEKYLNDCLKEFEIYAKKKMENSEYIEKTWNKK